ncbi:MAG: NAD(P)H-dependent glycerol-3-phosphate dehydrogenase [Oscillospiraceae bacterium]|nr:NAD(P)H-dependent glycerol-3-phosphate dehydrogenase [Oscillospiraceae bacterium]
MNVSVLGCGRWGSFLACYHSRHHHVTLWGPEGDAPFEILRKERKNSYITLPPKIELTCDLEKAVEASDYLVISISSQHLAEFGQRLNALDLEGKTFILCMKGIEAETGRRLTEIMEEVITQKAAIAVWVGPGHVQDFMKGIPGCMVVDAKDPATSRRIVQDFNSDLIRLYVGNDLIGTEVGAAAKNVIGIAAGMLDGKGYASLKGALMARGAREVSRLIKAMGGNELSAYGLCHLGDYEATLFSAYSHNRMYGESLVKGETFGELAEGAATVVALMKLSEKYQVDMPISRVVYEIIYCGKKPEEALQELFRRTTKGEFYE